MKRTISKEWFSAAQLASMGLPGLPGTPRGVTLMAERECWGNPALEGVWWRKRKRRGGGVEYRLCILPFMVARTQARVDVLEAAVEDLKHQIAALLPAAGEL